MSGPHEQSPVHPGEIVASGKYRVDRVLGIGGMGVVVAATHLHLGQAVAIKFMLPAALKDKESVERFLLEARSAAQLSSGASTSRASSTSRRSRAALLTSSWSTSRG